MRPRLSPILIAIAVLAVLAAYVFFASNGTMAFRRVAWDQKFERPAEGYYASLAEGFRCGQLSMAHEADPRLKAAFDPYRADVREQCHAPYLWDASFYRGRYYLYFTALPVVLFYLPFRVIAGAYPLDALAGVFFSAWAFIMATLTLRRAFLGRNLHLPLPLWILVIGLGNVIAFTLSFVRTYEVAILAATAMSATWAYALLRFIETQSAKHAMWMGLWLALAVVALLLRPAWRTRATPARAGPRLLAGARLVLLSLSACWYVVARYSLDFMLLMCIASAIAIECGLAQLAAHGISIRALRIGIVA